MIRAVNKIGFRKPAVKKCGSVWFIHGDNLLKDEERMHPGLKAQGTVPDLRKIFTSGKSSTNFVDTGSAAAVDGFDAQASTSSLMFPVGERIGPV